MGTSTSIIRRSPRQGSAAALLGSATLGLAALAFSGSAFAPVAKHKTPAAITGSSFLQSRLLIEGTPFAIQAAQQTA